MWSLTKQKFSEKKSENWSIQVEKTCGITSDMTWTSDMSWKFKAQLSSQNNHKTSRLKSEHSVLWTKPSLWSISRFCAWLLRGEFLVNREKVRAKLIFSRFFVYNVCEAQRTERSENIRTQKVYFQSYQTKIEQMESWLFVLTAYVSQKIKMLSVCLGTMKTKKYNFEQSKITNLIDIGKSTAIVVGFKKLVFPYY